VEEFGGTDGRLRFATPEAFLQRFGLPKFAGIDHNFAVSQSTRLWLLPRNKSGYCKRAPTV
jgi:hypothetical protein